MDEKQEGAPAPTVDSVTTGIQDAPTLVVGPSDGAGGVALPSGDTPWGPMGPLGDRLYGPKLLRDILEGALLFSRHERYEWRLLESVEVAIAAGLLPIVERRPTGVNAPDPYYAYALPGTWADDNGAKPTPAPMRTEIMEARLFAERALARKAADRHDAQAEEWKARIGALEEALAVVQVAVVARSPEPPRAAMIRAISTNGLAQFAERIANVARVRLKPANRVEALESDSLWKQDLARAMEERESFRKQAEQLAAELAGLLPEPVPSASLRRTLGFRELAEQRMERIMALHEALAKVYAAARPDLDDDSTDALDAVRHLKDGELAGFANELCEWLHDLAVGAATQSKGVRRIPARDVRIEIDGKTVSAEEVCADPRVDDSGEVTADPRMIRADEIVSVAEQLAVQADRAQAYEVLCTRLGFTESATELWPVDRVTEHLRDQKRELEAERVRADAAIERGKRWRDEVLHAQEQVAGARADAESARAQEHNAKYTRRRFVEMFADVLAEVFSATEPTRSSEGLFAALMGTLDPRVEVVGPALEALRLERKTSREFAREALHRESSVRAELCTVVDESFGPFPPMSRLSLDDLVSFVERALQVARREPDLMTEACEKLWRATAGRPSAPRLVVDTADVDVDGATRT